MPKHRLPPAWFLFLFAPVTAEYLSGSMPNLNPILILVNLVLYGCGALLIRELKVRWHQGWLPVFILSVGYTIAEEGLMLNTLFNPLENTAGRSLGVNWVWTAGMLLVHSLMSIFLPILVGEAIYHDRADEPWIKPGPFKLLFALFCANVFGMGTLIAKSKRPGLVYWIIELLLIAACLGCALWLPGPRSGPAAAPTFRSPRWFYFASFIGTIVTMVVGFVAPSLPLPALAKIAIMLGTYGAFLLLLKRRDVFHPALPARCQIAIGAGIISFWILVSPLNAFGKHNPFPVMIAVGMIIFLLKARKRIQLEEGLDGSTR